MTLTALFWNGREARLRAPFRVFIHIAVLFATLFVLSPIVVPFVIAVTASTFLGTSTGTFCAIVASTAISARFLDRRRLASFGFALGRDWWLDCGFGLLLGAGLMALVFLGEWTSGLLTVTGFVRRSGSVASSLLRIVGAFVAVAVYEELLMRGYLLTNLAEGVRGPLGSRGAVTVAVALTSGVFGLLHALNPHATTLSTATISLAGVFLAWGYLLTGELAIPIGIHTTWNVFQGVVFGFPVSGMRVDPSLIVVEQHGSRMLTGGSFGPEGGLIGAGAILLGMGLIAAYVRVRYGTVEIVAEVSRPPDLDPEYNHSPTSSA